MQVLCDYCGKSALLVTGREVYPRRLDLATLNYWKCSPCDAWAGCHEPEMGQGDGTQPKGRLANAELRAARQEAHVSFDSLWREGPLSRTKAYAWLSVALGIPSERCHIGMFDVDECLAVVRAVNQRQALVRPRIRVGSLPSK